MANSQKRYEGKSIHNAYFGGAFRAGVRIEQPLDIAACGPYGLYYPDSAYANRIFAVEDVECGIAARHLDGYYDGYSGSEYDGNPADSLLPSTSALCIGRTLVDIEGGGYTFDQATWYAFSSLLYPYDNTPLGTLLLC